LKPALARTASLTHVSTTSVSAVRCGVIDVRRLKMITNKIAIYRLLSSGVTATTGTRDLREPLTALACRSVASNHGQTAPSPIHSDRRRRGLLVAFARGARDSVVASDQQGRRLAAEGRRIQPRIGVCWGTRHPTDTVAVAAGDCTPAPLAPVGDLVGGGGVTAKISRTARRLDRAGRFPWCVAAAAAL
jgi:hypothetical protein